MKESRGSRGSSGMTEDEVFSKVASLFKGQEDLLAEFGQFLPDAKRSLVSVRILKIMVHFWNTWEGGLILVQSFLSIMSASLTLCFCLNILSSLPFTTDSLLSAVLFPTGRNVTVNLYILRKSIL